MGRIEAVEPDLRRAARPAWRRPAGLGDQHGPYRSRRPGDRSKASSAAHSGAPSSRGAAGNVPTRSCQLSFPVWWWRVRLGTLAKRQASIGEEANRPNLPGTDHGGDKLPSVPISAKDKRGSGGRSRAEAPQDPSRRPKSRDPTELSRWSMSRCGLGQVKGFARRPEEPLLSTRGRKPKKATNDPHPPPSRRPSDGIPGLPKKVGGS